MPTVARSPSPPPRKRLRTEISNTERSRKDNLLVDERTKSVREPRFVPERNSDEIDPLQKQQKAYALSCEQVSESKGFDVDPSRCDVTKLGAILPRSLTDKQRPIVMDCCNCALQNYNAQNKDSKFEFVEVVKFNTQVVNGLVYYITFEAKDAAASPDMGTRTFQAKVYHLLRNNATPQVQFCRMKPT